MYALIYTAIFVPHCCRRRSLELRSQIISSLHCRCSISQMLFVARPQGLEAAKTVPPPLAPAGRLPSWGTLRRRAF